MLARTCTCRYQYQKLLACEALSSRADFTAQMTMDEQHQLTSARGEKTVSQGLTPGKIRLAASISRSLWDIVGSRVAMLISR